MEGGERRLNVAVTRAKERMTLVSSFTHHDMDPERSRREGVELMRAYLEYCASNGSQLGQVATSIPELNPFEVDVRDSSDPGRNSPRRPVRRLWLPDRLRGQAPDPAGADGLGDRDATARATTLPSQRGTATGCGRSISNAWAGPSTASGRRTGSPTSRWRSSAPRPPTRLRWRPPTS